MAAPVVETISAAPGSYIPQSTMVTEVMAQPQVTYAAPPSAVMAQPMGYTTTPSYLPAVQQAPVVTAAAQPMTMGGAGQSVIVDQIGDWLVCEDAMGLFYH